MRARQESRYELIEGSAFTGLERHGVDPRRLVDHDHLRVDVDEHRSFEAPGGLGSGSVRGRTSSWSPARRRRSVLVTTTPPTEILPRSMSLRASPHVSEARVFSTHRAAGRGAPWGRRSCAGQRGFARILAQASASTSSSLAKQNRRYRLADGLAIECAPGRSTRPWCARAAPWPRPSRPRSPSERCRRARSTRLRARPA